MIRPYHPSDLDTLMTLWLETTIQAHPFVTRSYWEESAEYVRTHYLSQAETWIDWHQTRMTGFISVLEGCLIGALFVHTEYQGQGIGRALMEKVKQHYGELTLEVYRENERACEFYLQQGFSPIGQQFNEETQGRTLTMYWHRG